MIYKNLILLSLISLSFAHEVLAQSKNTKRVTPTPAAKPAPIKVDSSKADDYVVGSSTQFDFSETSIDGKMKAPDGFMLQGHQSSQLSQMVKLRSHFRNELNNSKSATKALVK